MVDCLTNIRLLRNLRPPVSVYFDKERLDSLDEKAEVFLTMLASFAQEESRSISTNIKWATRSRMKAGTQKISTTSLLGYDTDDDGEMVIVTNEAEIVRTIYMSFDKGMHPAEIAEKLNALEIRTMHYPVFCYNGQFRRGADGTPLTYMLHGHIHKSEDQVLVDRFSTETRAMMRKSAHQETAQPVPCQMINCFCMYSDYTPLTLEEWVECDQRRRDKADR